MQTTLFRNFPENSKIWIYQSNRELTDAEVQQASLLIKNFVQEWTSHSEKVVAEGAVIYNRFIVFAADESFVTLGGCSIDSSVNFSKQLEQKFSINLFDRLAIAYRENDNIKTTDQSAFQQLIEKGTVNSDTIIFNNLTPTLKDFNEKWETPLSKSWHARLFKVPVQ